MTRPHRLPLLAGLLLGLAACTHAAAEGPAVGARRVTPAPLVPKRGEGLVQLACTPASAEVVVDGVTYGYVSDFARPPYLKLSPGEHHILLRKHGFEPYRTDVYLSGSVIETLNVSLTRRAPPAARGARETQP